jgi:hypothetical protein
MTSSTFSATNTGIIAAKDVSHVQELRGKAKVYLVNPFFDLTFVCGGLAVALTAICVHQFGINVNAAQASMPVIVLGLLGTYLLAGPHTGATIFRLYGEKENRSRFYFVSFVLPVILIAALIAGLFLPVIARVEATIYLIAVWHHYMAQSYGVAMMYCARTGMRLSKKEKFLPRAVLYLAVSAAIAEQFTSQWQRSSFLNIPLSPIAFLPAEVVVTLQLCLALAVLALLSEQVIKWRNGQATMPLPAMAALLMGAAFLTLGRALSDIVWLFLPNFFHATQYLAVVLAYQHKKEAEKETKEDTIKPGNYSLLKTFGRLGDRLAEFFLIGLALFTIVPLAISALGFPFYLASALVFFSLSFHHFAADACIWKLKDKSVHSRLIT